MDANNFAGSDFMKAVDLGVTTPQIRISKVEEADFGQGEKPKLVIHPSDPAYKPVVLNVTNTRACIAAFGPNTDAWLNKIVMLSVRQTQMGPGIGVTPMVQPEAPAASLPPAGPVPAHMQAGPIAGPIGAVPQPVPDLPGQPGVPFDDDIPY